MTVCIACLCNWMTEGYPTQKVAITASDRQITAGDIEYEPNQLKISAPDSKTIILISGDYPTHSEALQRIIRSLTNNQNYTPLEKAEMYAGYIRDVKFRHACNIYLAPIGLTSEIFSKNDMVAENLLGDVATKVMNYRGEYTEAIVVAADVSTVNLYHVDSESRVTCQNDVEFVAIGAGAWHAKSQLMSTRYSNIIPFTTALGLLYAAKKRGEMAPGVGDETDMYLVTRQGNEVIWPEIKEEIKRLYDEYENERLALAATKLQALADKLVDIGKKHNSQSVPTNPTGPQDDPASSAAEPSEMSPHASEEPPAETCAGTPPRTRPRRSREQSE